MDFEERADFLKGIDRKPATEPGCQPDQTGQGRWQNHEVVHKQISKKSKDPFIDHELDMSFHSCKDL